jgi:DNA-binding transcriptional ArsR family regulator/ribosomal protein S19E (S16A)
MTAMTGFPGLSKIGALLADPGRAAMLWALMDGSARPASELSLLAGISPSAASGHLARLTDGGLLSLQVQGRHRYYRIAAPEIAAAVEALASAAQASAPHQAVPRPLARAVPLPLRHARTCYDHMAGEVAVGVFQHFLQAGWLSQAGDELEISPDGARHLEHLGVDLAWARGKRRRFACACLDWSERQPHLGGALGAALLQRWSATGWVERAKDSRALRITPAGQRGFDALRRA